MEDTREDVPPMSRRKIPEVHHRCAAVNQAAAKMMSDYLNKSEGLKVDTRELEYYVLAPNEPQVHCDARKRRKTSKTFPRDQSARSK